jgi:hypothetical protein
MKNHLEAELAEEPLVLASHVALLEGLLDGLAGLGAGGGVGEGLGTGDVEDLGVEAVELVAGGHHVVVVNRLEERLDAVALLHGLLAHVLLDLQGVAVNAGNDAVAVRALGSAIIVGLHDDSLAAGIAALENDDNLALLQDGLFRRGLTCLQPTRII